MKKTSLPFAQQIHTASHKKHSDSLVDLRREFHKHEELSFQKHRTATVIAGWPAAICDRLVENEKIGVGGQFLQFRLGPMPKEVAEQSLRLFAVGDRVAGEERVAVNDWIAGQAAPRFCGGREGRGKRLDRRGG